MIVLHVSGGLGNQMFQYAFGRAMANRMNVELLLDLSNPTLSIHQGFELSRVFGIKEQTATEYDMRAVLGWQRPITIRKMIKKLSLKGLDLRNWVEEPSLHFSSKLLQVPNNVYIDGYWQSEKYFADAIECIREQFKFIQPPVGLNNTLLLEIADSDTTAISLHVRRGDYVHNSAVKEVHGSCTLAYYNAAIQHVSSQVKNPFFYVFSDDLDWVKNHLEIPFPFKLISHNRGKCSFEDMRLMSLCQHHIIANSSFSWWGAWLNANPKKIVVAPKNWFADINRPHDLFPAGWSLL